MQLPTAAQVILLPAEKTQRDQPQTQTKRTKRALKILVIDDNEDAAKGIARLLNHSGHDARTALEGSEAMKTLAQFRPDS